MSFTMLLHPYKPVSFSVTILVQHMAGNILVYIYSNAVKDVTSYYHYYNVSCDLLREKFRTQLHVFPFIFYKYTNTAGKHAVTVDGVYAYTCVVSLL